MNPRYWRALWLAVVGLTTTAFTPAFADLQTKIVSINGNYATSHDAYLTVYPGDTVTLSADQLDVDYAGNSTPQNRYVEDFQWSSDVSQTDICDPEYDCSPTNFDVNSIGVSFDVPYNMGQQLTITVQNRSDGSYDQLTLVNGSYSETLPPTDYSGGSYSDPEDYPQDSDFDYNRGLAGHGRWVYISGERCFVPYSYQSDWRPYQNGRWIWTSYGWTWTSYDPWGYVTDHYGYWRHHSSYGWTWFPFPERRWYPAVVTWFHNDSGIGWYPYWGSYSRGYRHGYAQGYDDGYWDGYRAGLANSGYNWGWTYVSHSGFMSTNIYAVRVTNVRIHDCYNGAYAAGNYGVILRDHRSSNPRIFVETRIGTRIQATPVNVVSRRYAGGGQVQWVRPAQRMDIPAEYRQVRNQSDVRVRTGARVPVGSVVTPDGRVNRPSTPVVVRPNVPNRNGGYTPMPDRTRVPATQPRPSNPAPRPLPNRPAPSRPAPAPSRPAPAPSRPTQPAPVPSRPAPVPSRPAPAPTRPAPAPMPNRPAPAPSRPAPAPSRPAPAPAPSRPAPAPSRPAPAPSRPAPAPAPSRPAPAPSRPAPAPAPSRPAPAPSRPAPAPSRPAPAPSRPAPTPAPSRPSYPAPSRPAPAPAPSRPSYPAPSRPSPAPSRPSNPAPSRPSPAPSRPSPAPSRPSPSPSRPSPRPRQAITEVSKNVVVKSADALV